MTIFEKTSPKLPPARKHRFKAFTAAGRAKWRRGKDWWERLEMDAQEKRVSRRRRFWSRVAVSVLSTSLALAAWLAVALIVEAASYLWLYVGWIVVLFLNWKHLVRVTWHDHWKD